MNLGFVKVASIIPDVVVGDTNFNIKSIINQCVILPKDVELAVFPELCVTGYTCGDLFHTSTLLEDSEIAVIHFLEMTRTLDTFFVIGAPIEINSAVYNCAIVCHEGNIISIVPKTFLPNYKEFYEQRWFASKSVLNDVVAFHYAGQHVAVSGKNEIINVSNRFKFGIEICEDVWSPIPPSSFLALEGADIIVNLSASDELTTKNQYLRSLLSQQSARTISGYIYSSCGSRESTQDVVYGGNALIYENGSLLASNIRFDREAQTVTAQIDIEKLRSERRKNTSFFASQGLYKNNFYEQLVHQSREYDDVPLQRKFNPYPFDGCDLDEVFEIQIRGLMNRLCHIGARKAVIGVSGGSDSTLALLVCAATFERLCWDKKGIIGVTMPCFGTTERTKNNAIELMEGLGITIKTVDITKSVLQHFQDIGLDENDRSVTYENCQARERTQVLMDIANMENGIVIGTGDLSELALGWCTYNADHMSMYNVNVSIPKTLVKLLISNYCQNILDYSQTVGSDQEEQQICLQRIADCLNDILATPVSPELLPPNEDGTIQQVTEDNIGPYDLHDFFLYYFLRFGFRPTKIFYMAKSSFEGKFDAETIKKWLKVFFKRFFTQQFKRSCLPDGPKVGSVSLSPRGDWRMPSDASYNNWIQEIDSIEV